jgi:replicative DNA helicase
MLADTPATPTRSTRQVPPATGRPPDAETLLLGGLLGALAVDAAEVLALIENTDMQSPANAVVLDVIRTAVVLDADVFGPAVVWDRLTRNGSRREVRKAMLDASTSGAASTPGALAYYASMIVAAAYRRQMESIGLALVTASSDAPEVSLSGLVDAAVAKLRATEERLRQLRGSC